MTVRRALTLLAVLTLALPLVFIAGYTRLNPTASQEMQTYTVSRSSAAIIISSFGAVQAEEVVNLSFQLPGQVAEVLVEEGDTINEGDALVRLDSRTQYAAYDQANLTYELAVRQLEDLRTIDEDEVELAEANLQSARKAYADIANAVTLCCG